MLGQMKVVQGLIKVAEQKAGTEAKGSLTQILETDARKPNPDGSDGSMKAASPPQASVYSPKLKRYVPLDPSAKGKIQKYNIGLGPGSWY